MVNRYLLLAGLRELARHKVQSALSVLGIALGVAIVVAVDLANTSAQKAFTLSIKAVSGTATHQIISAGQSFPLSVFEDLQDELEIYKAAPVVDSELEWRGQEYRLVGVDPYSEAELGRLSFATEHAVKVDDGRIEELLTAARDGVAISERQAELHQLSVGDEIKLSIGGNTGLFTVRVLLDTESNPGLDKVIMVYLPTAQRILGLDDSIHRIDMVLEADEVALIQDWLPPQLLLHEVERQQANMEALTSSFQTNLMAMSLLAIMVGGLLVYSTVNFSFLKRRREFGICLGLGVSRGEMAAVLITEILCISVFASLLGLLLGYALSTVLVQFITRTIDDIYFNLTVTEFMVAPEVLVRGFLLGIGTSLLATALPVVNAAHTSPVSLQRLTQGELDAQARFQRLFIFGLLLFVIGYIASEMVNSLIPGFAALMCIIFGFCLTVPMLLVWVNTRVTSWISATRLYRIIYVFRALENSVSRTGVACAAFTVAIATVIAVATMIGSFRNSVDAWISQVMDADVYISVPEESSPDRDAFDRLHRELLADPKVYASRQTLLWSVDTQYGNYKAASSVASDGSMRRRQWIQTTQELKRDWNTGKGVAVSEPMASHQDLTIGDSLEVHTLEGLRSYPVLGIFRDYSSSHGVVLFPPEIRKRYWPGMKSYRIALYFDGGLLSKSIIRNKMQAHGLEGDITEAWEYRQRSIEIFDRTFAITHVLKILVLIVAFVGVLSAMMALQLEKMREYAVLRAGGVFRRELATMILGQSSVLGFYSAFFAMPFGALMADRLIQVINKVSFGWSIDSSYDPWIFPQVMGVGVAAATLASIYPAIKSGSKDIALALREE